MTAIGRGINAGPASDLFPLSAQLPSTPAILITGTTAAAQTTAHTADAVAYDMPYMLLWNVSSAAITAYANTGSTVTTGNRVWSVPAGDFKVAYAYDVAMSNSGVFGFWASATTGLYVTGNVARIFTASA